MHELAGGGRPPPDDPVPAGERDDRRSAVDPDAADEPVRPSGPDGTPTSAVERFHDTLGQKVAEIESLRSEVEQLRSQVAEFASLAQRVARMEAGLQAKPAGSDIGN